MVGAQLGTPAAAAPQGAVDPDHGIVAVTRLLRGLGSVKRVLVIGAHPDDEDTSLLTWLERGLGADAAYLSLNRGEGGQNLIGPELGVGLGLIRTEELLAARRLDGATQFFTRAYDFGYSKTADETFRFWPRDSVLADVVSVVRRFRPQIIVSIFSGTPRDRHGQHQVAGILAPEAFEAAGDPLRFPEQVAQGLEPWRPLKLYRSTRFDPGASTLRIATGELDLLYGRSYHQIAMASRSQHRSQDMGRIERLGPRSTTLQLLRSRVGNSSGSGESSLFDGVDTTLVGMVSALHSPEARRKLTEGIVNYGAQLARARGALGQWQPPAAAPHLSAALAAVRHLIETAKAAGPEAGALIFVLADQARKLEIALTESAGVLVEAFSDDDLVVPGQSLEIEVQIWNGGGQAVSLDGVSLRTPPGWRVTALDRAVADIPPSSLVSHRFRVTVPPNAEVTQPYFARTARAGALYSWPADLSVRGLPFGPPPVRAYVELSVRGREVRREVEAVYRFADQARGEVRRPIRVVPGVGVRLSPEQTVLPLGAREERVFSVALRSESLGTMRGRARLEVPPGWSVTPADAPFQLRGPGSGTTVEFRARPPPSISAGTYRMTAVAIASDGQRYERGYSIIDYPHIRRQVLFTDAAAEVVVFDLVVDEDRRVGYVPGAGDVGADAVRAMGLQVEELDGRAVAAGDLSAYDVILLGIRAYERNPAVTESNDRLLDWVRSGGTLIVQYQQYAYFNGDYAPYRLRARRPHDRVSDENAAVTVLVENHPVFSWPNRIGPSDFEGWVQERGLYFASEWDERYEVLLELADAGEDPKRGGLLIAQVGDGLYVYTGLALFRQLPAGVPGAYRLLANLLSLSPRAGPSE